MPDVSWFCIFSILVSGLASYLVEPAIFDDSVVLGLGAEEVLFARFKRHGKMMPAGWVYAEPSSEIVLT